MYDTEMRPQTAGRQTDGPRADEQTPYMPRAPRERQRVSPWIKVAGALLMLFALALAATAWAVGMLQGMAVVSVPASATISRAFTTTGAPTLIVHVDAGNIRIDRGPDGQVALTLKKQVFALTHDLAQRSLDAISFDTSQSGDTISVTSHDTNNGIRVGSLDRTFDLHVTLPATATLNVNLAAGNLTIAEIAGTQTIQMAAGNIEMHGVTLGGDSTVKVAAGNVSIYGALAPAANLRVSVSAGNSSVYLPTTSATHVEASTTFGAITVTGWPHQVGQVIVKSVATLDLNPNPNSTLTVHSTAGNITVAPGA